MTMLGNAPSLIALPLALLASAAGGGAAADEGGGGMLKMLGGLGIYIPLVIANLVIFLGFFAIIRSILFERVRGHMQARDRVLADGRAEVRGLEQKQAEAEGRLGEARKALDKEAHERAQEQVRRGLARKTEVVQAAQDEAIERVRKVRAECAALEGTLARDGRADIVRIALEMVRIASAETLAGDAVKGALEKGVDARLAAGRSS